MRFTEKNAVTVRNVSLAMISALVLAATAVNAENLNTDFSNAKSSVTTAAAPVTTGVSFVIGERINFSVAQERMEKAVAMVESGTPVQDKEVRYLVGDAIHVLRGPKADASNYNYAAAVMKKDAESVKIASAKIDKIWDIGERQTLAADASTLYAFRIKSPMHRAFFRNNGRIYLESYKLEYTINGKTSTETKVVKDWIEKDNAVDVPLPGIAERATIEITVAVERSDVMQTIVEIEAKYPVITDDSRNPFSYSIYKLRDAQSSIELNRGKNEVSKAIAEAIGGIQTVVTAVPSAGAPQPASMSVIPSVPPAECDSVADRQKLEEILYLLEGKADEQTEGKNKLKAIIDESR